MKVRIIRDSGITKTQNLADNLYGRKLGGIFEVIREEGNTYDLALDNGRQFMALKEDCLIIERKSIAKVASDMLEEPKENYYEVWPGIEALDVIASLLEKEEFIGFLKGNILKYQLRKGNKPGEPLEKDQDKLNHYKQILKELL
jgi:hypothetical protein